MRGTPTILVLAALLGGFPGAASPAPTTVTARAATAAPADGKPLLMIPAPPMDGPGLTSPPATPSQPAAPLAAKPDGPRTQDATGSFDIRVTPEASIDRQLSRASFAKTYSGDLKGTGKGEMAGIHTDAPGSAAYVAIERIEATLAGRKGGFALQQSVTMVRGKLHGSTLIVPDSGTGALAGIFGAMAIRQEKGQHHYTLRYGFAPPAAK